MELLVGQQLTDPEIGIAGINADIRFEVQDALQIAKGHLEDIADTRRE